MDGGAGIALLIFCGIFVLFFPWKSEKPKPKNPEPKPETFVELPQGYGYQAGYPIMPGHGMSPGLPGYPQVNPITTQHQVGGNRILKVGDRLYIQQQLPPGTGSGNQGEGSHG